VADRLVLARTRQHGDRPPDLVGGPGAGCRSI
jgi:hypothetical protein